MNLERWWENLLIMTHAAQLMSHITLLHAKARSGGYDWAMQVFMRRFFIIVMTPISPSACTYTHLLRRSNYTLYTTERRMTAALYKILKLHFNIQRGIITGKIVAFMVDNSTYYCNHQIVFDDYTDPPPEHDCWLTYRTINLPILSYITHLAAR